MFVFGAFERIHSEVGDGGSTESDEGFLPNFEAFAFLFEEGDFPIIVAESGDAAVVGPVNEFLAWPWGFALESGEEVIAVEVDFVGGAADFASFEEVFFGGGIASGGG